MDTGIKVGDCMKTTLVTISDAASVIDAAKKIAKERVSSLLVTDSKGKIYAIITTEDLVKKVLAENRLDESVGKLASKPLIGLPVDADLNEAARLMGSKRTKRVVVFDKSGRVVGLVSSRDIAELSPSLYNLIAEKARLK